MFGLIKEMLGILKIEVQVCTANILEKLISFLDR